MKSLFQGKEEMEIMKKYVIQNKKQKTKQKNDKCTWK
jgi:hypothetical protein